MKKGQANTRRQVLINGMSMLSFIDCDGRLQNFFPRRIKLWLQSRCRDCRNILAKKKTFSAQRTVLNMC